MKLYVVTVEKTLCVVAESAADAECLAERVEAEDMGDAFVHAVEVTRHGLVPVDWLDCLPYRDDSVEETVATIVKRIEAGEKEGA